MTDRRAGHGAGVPGTARPDSDRFAAIVRAAQRGDALAMHDLLDEITPYVQRLCGPIALHDAADATQETLIVVLRRLGTLREPAALFGWVRMIAIREAVRVAGPASRVPPTDPPDLPGPDDTELATDIADVLQRLAPEQRAVLVLRDIEGLTEQRAGELLRIPAGTVRSRLFRARRSFRKAWLTERTTP
ncbi:RNA polymerase sigma factor [Kribbella pittospori]|uniref:RNA polymerase sigma factor n=1 Tax=Kribbella pittospori TaxID=722689 RepID=A0A4R0JPP6_9ACTN|nr:RNA polymerase sigma factor [Kribbella pittospori]TCC46966.1 RNA polymerase sigma factor [Kribbella pittospori]